MEKTATKNEKFNKLGTVPMGIGYIRKTTVGHGEKASRAPNRPTPVRYKTPPESPFIFIPSKQPLSVSKTFSSPRLRRAFIALQARKLAIYSDPLNTTADWVCADVRSYTRVFCAPALDDPKLEVVVGIDLNHADIAGYLPVELNLLTDIALFHINNNRFCSIVPSRFSKLTLLHELDISNNRFVGHFPKVVVRIPNLKYMDIKYNDFEGQLSPKLFTKEFDVIFLNNNRFTSYIPENFGKSAASIIVIANNNFTRCIIMDISLNLLTGVMQDSLCNLAKLVNFTFSYNLIFNGEDLNTSPIPEPEAPKSSPVLDPKAPTPSSIDDSYDQSPVPRYRPPPPLVVHSPPPPVHSPPSFIIPTTSSLSFITPTIGSLSTTIGFITPPPVHSPPPLVFSPPPMVYSPPPPVFSPPPPVYSPPMYVLTPTISALTFTSSPPPVFSLPPPSPSSPPPPLVSTKLGLPVLFTTLHQYSRDTERQIVELSSLF
ncbi:unnamed protein product [Citrullus colocynthis]|uniref:Uncharacterized protein n=1 Tax=Citrullus colocynthis TaxID=252529 RepID=A0ABP0YDM6_9ROSI